MMREEINPRGIYYTSDLCRILGASPTTISKWIKQGKLRAKRFGSRYVVLGSTLLATLEPEPVPDVDDVDWARL
jgi:excisionase family DNA binding protein